MNFIDIFLIGVGLAIDAGCVCTSNGLIYKPDIKDSVKYAFVFAIFQGVMPMLGYLGVGVLDIKLLEYNSFIALILLSIVGGKMIYESFGNEKEAEECTKDISVTTRNNTIGFKLLFLQGVSTSLDALSVGITFYKYSIGFVLCSATLIAVVTWFICYFASRIGIRIGTKLNTKAELLGGIVLVLLGIKIFLLG